MGNEKQSTENRQMKMPVNHRPCPHPLLPLAPHFSAGSHKLSTFETVSTVSILKSIIPNFSLIRILNLFRISCFGFRISSPHSSVHNSRFLISHSIPCRPSSNPSPALAPHFSAGSHKLSTFETVSTVSILKTILPNF